MSLLTTAAITVPALSHAVALATGAVPAEYTVQPGDTVSEIAARHGLSTQAVLAANDLGWDSVIMPGQTLALSAPPEAAPTPAPESVADAVHTVAAGETISAIAARYATTTEAVLEANAFGWDTIIYPGQQIRIRPEVIAAEPAAATAAPQEPATALDAEQSENARLIIRIGRELGVSDRGIAIALGTAMQESWLRNLDWGDRDSQGLFQQRPSQGWGTVDEVRDPDRATRAFFGGAGNPNESTRGLLDIPGWHDMSYTDAAQAVQLSAYPDRYGRWEGPSTTWLAALG